MKIICEHFADIMDFTYIADTISQEDKRIIRKIYLIVIYSTRVERLLSLLNQNKVLFPTKV
jgi:hypothetical protein